MSVLTKRHFGVDKSTIMTFLQNQNWRCFLHHHDLSNFSGPKLLSQFLGWKKAIIPHLFDSDGRALHKDSESGPNSKITKNTEMTSLQNTADCFGRFSNLKKVTKLFLLFFLYVIIFYSVFSYEIIFWPKII